LITFIAMRATRAIMNSNAVDKIAYNQLYEFILKSESKTEFVERLQTLSTILLQEVTERVVTSNVHHAIQLIPLIDEMNQETMELIDRINNTEIIFEQPPILNTMFLRLIQLYNKKMFADYMYAKTALQN
jgi:hypothetical protein